MSKVSNIASPIAREALRKQQQLSTLVSITMALLIMALIALMLAIILMVIEEKEIPTIVSYSANSEIAATITRPKQNTKVSRKPSSPSSSMARVITSNSATPTAIPTPEFDVPEPSLDYGNGDDFGDGWGEEDFGDGGGSATFFGQEVRAERIAYVIDYSSSMKSQNREGLMRAELGNSLSKMREGLQLGLIFFAGPAWGAGGTVKKGIVTSSSGKEYKWKSNQGAHNTWEHDGRKEKIKWITVSPGQVRKYKKTSKKPNSLEGRSGIIHFTWPSIWIHHHK
ncbi:MAG: hypothetical protein ACON5H_06010 [Akkermansiaceae bacterium]